MAGIPGKVAKTPWGARPHEWGDNQSMVLHVYSSLSMGVEIMAPGQWGRRDGIAGQTWRCWAFDHFYWNDFNFWGELVKAMGGKPLGPYIWVPDSYWVNGGNHPQFRVPGYRSPQEDMSVGYTGPRCPRSYEDGYACGYADGYGIGKCDGIAEGKKRSKGKKREGQGQG